MLLVLFGAAEVANQNNGTGTGKPNITDTSGNNEYYLIPVSGLQKVTVNGIDMSSQIRNSAIVFKLDVMDNGQIEINTGREIDNDYDTFWYGSV